MEDLRIAVMKELGGFPYGPGVAIHRYVDTSTIQSALVYFISQMLMVLLKMAIYYRVLFVQLLPLLLDIVMCWPILLSWITAMWGK